MNKRNSIIFFTLVFLLFPSIPGDTTSQNSGLNKDENQSGTIHVYVALCDNKYQGIVKVKPSLGNGDDLKGNLYWGAMYGIKSYFKRSKKWGLIKVFKNPKKNVLERCVFRYNKGNIFLVADAFRGRNIKEAIVDFLKSASGANEESVVLDSNAKGQRIPCAGHAELIVYVGHNGLMDFNLDTYPGSGKRNRRKIIILACLSKFYFKPAVKASGAFPLLWTTGLMAPEAYTLEAALDGWINDESNQLIRKRAARAYHKYQDCGIRSALKLLVTGW